MLKQDYQTRPLLLSNSAEVILIASDDGNDFDQNTVDNCTETIIPRIPGIEVTKTSTIMIIMDNSYGRYKLPMQ